MQHPKKRKLYRYRPLTEVLFKELLYSEIHLASPEELNDPLDLNGQLNFFTENEKRLEHLHDSFPSKCLYCICLITGMDQEQQSVFSIY